MYEIFKNIISIKDYELVDILNKIDEYYVKSKLTKEEKEELEDEARTNANPENSYAPIMEQLNEAFKRIEALESDVKELKGESIEEPIEPTDEYPEYVQPTGAHDAYNIGDKITYNDKKYVCKMDGCVWTPDAYPAGWEEVTEEGGMSNEYEN